MKKIIKINKNQLIEMVSKVADRILNEGQEDIKSNKGRIIYGYGLKDQILYEFKIVNEDIDFYYVKDISTTWSELALTRFLVDKNTLKIVGNDNHKFDFILRNDICLSFNKDDIIKIIKQQNLKLLQNEYSNIDQKINNARNELKASENTKAYTPNPSALQNLKRKDVVYVEYKNELYPAIVIGKTITGDEDDNDVITPLINCDKLDIYHCVVNYSSFEENFVVVKPDNDSFSGEYEYDVYLSKEDYQNKLNYNKYKKNEQRLENLINRKSYIEREMKKNS